MKLIDTGDGFKLWLSRNDTSDWAFGLGPNGKKWPCSGCEGRRLFVEFDQNGLLDMTVDGRSSFGRIHIGSDELSAIVCDHVEGKITEDHPAYFVAVGQFK